MKQYDIIIIGAGPGGIKCAEILQKAGKNILLLEKKREVGPKVCAGGLTRKDVEYFHPPGSILEFKFMEAWLQTPLQRVVAKASKPILFTIDRKKFGQWQMKTAGVKARTNSKVTEIGKDYVIVNNKEKIKFKYLVGADGSASIVRKHLGLKTESYCLCMHYVVKGNRYSTIEAHFDSSLFKNGYAWIFPHNGYASIGCGAEPKDMQPDILRKKFEKWIKKNNINISNAKFEAFPINFDYKGYNFGNIFLVGDAAGLATDATGEGIYQAAASGEDVARIILNKSHKPVLIEEILRKKQKSRQIENILLKMGIIRPIAFEILALALRMKWLQRLAKKVFT